jgi:hypothetical protein
MAPGQESPAPDDHVTPGDPHRPEPSAASDAPSDEPSRPATGAPQTDDEAKQSEGLATGIGIGLALGAGVGIVLDNLALGIGMGMALGVAVGISIDEKRKRGRH